MTQRRLWWQCVVALVRHVLRLLVWLLTLGLIDVRHHGRNVTTRQATRTKAATAAAAAAATVATRADDTHTHRRERDSMLSSLCARLLRWPTALRRVVVTSSPEMPRALPAVLVTRHTSSSSSSTSSSSRRTRSGVSSAANEDNDGSHPRRRRHGRRDKTEHDGSHDTTTTRRSSSSGDSRDEVAAASLPSRQTAASCTLHSVDNVDDTHRDGVNRRGHAHSSNSNSSSGGSHRSGDDGEHNYSNNNSSSGSSSAFARMYTARTRGVTAAARSTTDARELLRSTLHRGVYTAKRLVRPLLRIETELDAESDTGGGGDDEDEDEMSRRSHVTHDDDDDNDDNNRHHRQQQRYDRPYHDNANKDRYDRDGNAVMSPTSLRQLTAARRRRAQVNSIIRRCLRAAAAADVQTTLLVHTCTWNVDQTPPPTCMTARTATNAAAQSSARHDEYGDGTSDATNNNNHNNNNNNSDCYAFLECLLGPALAATIARCDARDGVAASAYMCGGSHHNSSGNSSGDGSNDGSNGGSDKEEPSGDEAGTRTCAAQQQQQQQQQPSVSSPSQRPPLPADVLRQFPDVVVVTLQEVDMGGVALVRESTASSSVWTAAIVHLLHTAVRGQLSYRKLKVVQLVGLVLVVLAQAQHVDYIAHVRLSLTRTGAMRVLGNKGSVCMRATIYGKRFLIVAAHFVAHAHNETRRRRNYHAALRDIRFDMPDGTDDESEVLRTFIHADWTTTSLYARSFVKGRSAWDRLLGLQAVLRRRVSAELERRALDAHDYVFFLGDLNSRLHALSHGDVHAHLRHRAYDYLLCHDELRQGMVSGAMFDGFEEPHIEFAPTYKYVRGSSDYDTRAPLRDPAWCDRVLFRVLRTADDQLDGGGSDVVAHDEAAATVAAAAAAVVREGDGKVRSEGGNDNNAAAAATATHTPCCSDQSCTESATHSRSFICDGTTTTTTATAAAAAAAAVTDEGVTRAVQAAQWQPHGEHGSSCSDIGSAKSEDERESSCTSGGGGSSSSSSSSNNNSNNDATAPVIDSRHDPGDHDVGGGGASVHIDKDESTRRAHRPPSASTFHAAHRPRDACALPPPPRFPMVRNCAVALEYYSVDRLTQSDHRPVCARFAVTVVRLAPQLVAEVQEVLRASLQALGDAEALFDYSGGNNNSSSSSGSGNNNNNSSPRGDEDGGSADSQLASPPSA